MLKNVLQQFKKKFGKKVRNFVSFMRPRDRGLVSWNLGFGSKNFTDEFKTYHSPCPCDGFYWFYLIIVKFGFKDCSFGKKKSLSEMTFFYKLYMTIFYLWFSVSISGLQSTMHWRISWWISKTFWDNPIIQHIILTTVSDCEEILK